jgi:alcohol dehydrogenase class IV
MTETATPPLNRPLGPIRTAPLDTVGESFGLLRLPRTVLFGPGQRRAVGPIVAEIGRSVLICTDERLAGSPELAEIVAALETEGVQVRVFGETQPELPVAGITDCVSGLVGTSVEVVIGVGGGSCLDMAKVVALLLSHGGTPQDYYGENRVPGPTMPLVAIPTTAGTGSEATPVAVISDPDRAMKVGISSPYLIPQVAVCDPELTHTCPASLTAASGIDAVVHLVESFTAIRRPATGSLATERVFVGKSDFTDMAALSGLELMGRSLLTAHRSPFDAAAREDVMRASLYGGIALGTGGTAAAHALQYPIGALTHTPHGFGTGALIPYVMRFNLPARVEEFGRIADALGASVGADDPVTRAHAGIAAVDALVDGLGIPTTLTELGVREDQLPRIAEDGLTAKRLVENNPRPVDGAAMLAIARAAFEGDRSFPVQ